MHHLPLIAPRPPRLSTMTDALREIEESGVFSNGGPVVRRFEAAATERLFGGAGDCLAVANATLGLMLAIHEAAGGRREGYALMPSFTFAAAAHAALWAGLTPLLCDVDPADWTAAAHAEEEAFARHGDRIAVIVPYATFGAAIDLDRYVALAARHGAGLVVDAAASLGTRVADGRNFASDARCATVFSMHATKTFATAEGGLIHSADADRIETLRRMTNFGFGTERAAIGPGLNAKLPELLGLLALAKLDELDQVADHRAALAAAYRARLGDAFVFQTVTAPRQAGQFMPLLLPRALAPARPAIIAALGAQGIGAGAYFSPHLARQPYFARTCVALPTPVADDVAARMLSLPITDGMNEADVATVCDALPGACASVGLHAVRRRAAPPVVATLLVGGGPGGTALLTAASKAGRLVELAQSGLCVVERGAGLGGGALGGYAITSDSTAETFLTAAKDNPHPSVAALADHPGGVEIARHVGALGVPLARTAPFLEALGEALGGIVADHGGSVLTRHEVLDARRTRGGLWASRVRGSDGGEREIVARNVVIATGGTQSRAHVGAERVAGATLQERLGERLILSDDLLRLGGVDALRTRLAGNRAPRIAIVGASTSALAAATLLLKSDLPLGAGALTLVHRAPLRPFYPSAEAALADGFADFGADDICALSGFVYRLAGFRLEARELVLRLLGVGGRVADPRLALHRLAGDDDAAAGALLDRADVVIAALGYRPRALPLFAADGSAIALAAHAAGRPRLVDQQCRVIDARGRPLPGAYGIGLAAGFVPSGALGGERSFRGKANGLWLWQNDVGRLIVDQLLRTATRAAAA